jgi:hypothetical protein
MKLKINNFDCVFLEETEVCGINLFGIVKDEDQCSFCYRYLGGDCRRKFILTAMDALCNYPLFITHIPASPRKSRTYILFSSLLIDM